MITVSKELRRQMSAMVTIHNESNVIFKDKIDGDAAYIAPGCGAVVSYEQARLWFGDLEHREANPGLWDREMRMMESRLAPEQFFIRTGRWPVKSPSGVKVPEVQVDAKGRVTQTGKKVDPQGRCFVKEWRGVDELYTHVIKEEEPIIVGVPINALPSAGMGMQFRINEDPIDGVSPNMDTIKATMGRSVKEDPVEKIMRGK